MFGVVTEKLEITNGKYPNNNPVGRAYILQRICRNKSETNVEIGHALNNIDRFF